MATNKTLDNQFPKSSEKSKNKMDTFEPENLKNEITHLESEARMIIPGIKALFGFQLVAVFSERFGKELTDAQKTCHWAALLCSALAVILALAPAAYHRQAEPHSISTRLARLTNQWLTVALIPLMFGYLIDFYLIGVLILKNPLMNWIATGFLAAAFVIFWFVFPNFAKHHPGARLVNQKP